MKCLTQNGKIMEQRYPNDRAAELVKSGTYAYCGKVAWKKAVRDRKKNPSQQSKIWPEDPRIQ